MITSKEHSLLHLHIKVLVLSLFRHSVIKLKALALLFQLRHSIRNQASLLGLLITFANNFPFNLVVMLVYFVNQSLVANLIYSQKLILLSIVCMSAMHFFCYERKQPNLK